MSMAFRRLFLVCAIMIAWTSLFDRASALPQENATSQPAASQPVPPQVATPETQPTLPESRPFRRDGEGRRGRRGDGEGPGARRDEGAPPSDGDRGPGGEGGGPGGFGGFGGGPGGPPKPRRGLPVMEPLIYKHCVQCHKVEPTNMVGRISYLRKSPEGWELSLKRMIRHHDLDLTPDDARQIIRYLSNDHGLTRGEAERALYEQERRVHWSEDKYDKELKDTCGACHAVGRAMMEQRDDQEWKWLKTTHMAFFPLVRGQAFGGGRGGFGGGGGGEGGEQIDWTTMSPDEIEAAMERRRQREEQGGDRADRVLAKLAKDQPLFTPEWENWTINRREVPLAGTWSVVGREPGRGEITGTFTVTRTGEDQYESSWDLVAESGETIKRKGKGLLYAGYSWRGRNWPPEATQSDAQRQKKDLREVLLLSEDWNEMKGRLFTGEYNELGADVRLFRRAGMPQIHYVQNGALQIPSENQEVDVRGDGFTAAMTAQEFFIGKGVTIKGLKFIAPDHVKLTVDVARNAERGQRTIALRSFPGRTGIVLFDTIDYIKTTPGEGMARIGGISKPKMFERFETVAMNRGKDDIPYNADDFEVKYVKASYTLEEFFVRDGDDDLKYVGAIDPATGVFTPAVDGPNKERKWQANNVGDVYVVAKCTLTVRKIEKKKEEKPAESQPTSAPASQPSTDSQPSTQPTSQPASQPTSKPVYTQTGPIEPPVDQSPIVFETKEFKARGHLLVTVPIYAMWDRLEWKDE